MNGKAQDRNGSPHGFLFDQLTGILVRIASEHHHIHTEETFHAFYNRTTAATDAHRSGIFFRIPVFTVAKQIHMVFSFGASTAAFYSLHEDCEVDLNEGTHGVSIFNRDRSSLNESKLFDNSVPMIQNKLTTFTEVQLAAAGFNPGTIFSQEAIQSGAGPKPAGGLSRGQQEFLLKSDTNYMALITNTAASANAHTIVLDWYEKNA